MVQVLAKCPGLLQVDQYSLSVGTEMGGPVDEKIVEGEVW